MPERDAPIIPNATRYQGDSLFAEKKVLLSSFPFVKWDIVNNHKKYRKIILKIRVDDILIWCISNIAIMVLTKSNVIFV